MAENEKKPLVKKRDLIIVAAVLLIAVAGMVAVKFFAPDTATGTAILTTGDMALAADPKAASYISAARALELALQHAGVSAADTVFLKSKLDWDHDHTCYEVEFYCGDTEYDYELDAVTGAVLNYSHELDCYDIHYARGGHHAEKGGHHGASAGTDLISQEQAQAIALDRAPAGAVVV